MSLLLRRVALVRQGVGGRVWGGDGGERGERLAVAVAGSGRVERGRRAWEAGMGDQFGVLGVGYTERTAMLASLSFNLGPSILHISSNPASVSSSRFSASKESSVSSMIFSKLASLPSRISPLTVDVNLESKFLVKVFPGFPANIRSTIIALYCA